jgi:hypothetical protein
MIIVLFEKSLIGDSGVESNQYRGKKILIKVYYN